MNNWQHKIYSDFMEQRLKIAIQKKGRLSDKSKALLKECGIKINNGRSRLIAPASNFPIDILFLRDDDIPQYVADGTADLGMVGLNEVEEKDKDILIAKRLGFSKCRISLAIPKGEEYTDITYFQGKKIATSYPVILEKCLAAKNVTADIHEISGSVEIAPGIGLADSIFDIVSTGSTLFSNGLKEVEVLMKSEAVLVANKNLTTEKQAILNRLLFRIESVQRAKNNKYVVLNAPNDAVDEISAVLPGMKSPTVVPLQREGWSAIHSVIGEDTFWEIIEQLKAKGAQGILVMPIEKMVL